MSPLLLALLLAPLLAGCCGPPSMDGQYAGSFHGGVLRLSPAASSATLVLPMPSPYVEALEVTFVAVLSGDELELRLEDVRDMGPSIKIHGSYYSQNVHRFRIVEGSTRRIVLEDSDGERVELLRSGGG